MLLGSEHQKHGAAGVQNTKGMVLLVFEYEKHGAAGVRAPEARCCWCSVLVFEYENHSAVGVCFWCSNTRSSVCCWRSNTRSMVLLVFGHQKVERLVFE